MRNVEDIADCTAAGIALAYRSGETSPVEVTECLLERIGQARDTNIFISVSEERARGEAMAAAARYAEGRPLSPLDGVPLAWKDVFDVAGSPTTAGSKVVEYDTVKALDAPCVSNAAAAGLVSVGKLNMSEFAYSGLGLNPHYGTPHNPNDATRLRSPGGSSSGAGSAVAARLVPCAIGTDTGGSVRIPAAFNGVVGYKTSTGRIDSTGMFPLATTYDTIGPLAHSVEDCILLDMILRGAVTTPVRRTDLSTLTIVVPKNVVLDHAQSSVLDSFERTLSELGRAGVRIRSEHVGPLDGVVAMCAEHGTLTAAEAYNEYKGLMDGEGVGAMDRRVARRITDGKRMSANDVLSIQRRRPQLIASLARQLDGALLAMPTTPITAPEVAPLEADDEAFHKINLQTLRNTMLGNVLDLCGLALPNGRDRNGLPTSVLFSALHGEDDRLLGFGLELERVTRSLYGPM